MVFGFIMGADSPTFAALLSLLNGPTYLIFLGNKLLGFEIQRSLTKTLNNSATNR